MRLKWTVRSARATRRTASRLAPEQLHESKRRPKMAWIWTKTGGICISALLQGRRHCHPLACGCRRRPSRSTSGCLTITDHLLHDRFGKNEDATSDRVDTGTALYALVRDRLAEDDQEEDPLMHPDYAVDPQGSLPTQPMKRQRTESSQIPTAADSQGQQAGQSSDGQTSKVRCQCWSVSCC